MNARRPPLLSTALALVATGGILLAGGCAQMQVKRQGTPDGSEVYDLRGRDLDRLRAEAAQRCPHGYDTLRQSQKSSGMESALAPARWWNAAAGYLEDAGSQSQLLVSCKAAPPAVVTDGSAK